MVYHKDLFSDQHFLTFFLCDLFLIVDDIDIASYVNEDTPYCTSNIRDEVKVTLKAASIKVFQWFYNNGMKANIDHVISSQVLTSPPQ